MEQQFDKKVFELAFAKALKRIASAEKVTKEALRDLSRTILEAWHTTGDVSYANKLLAVLTPVNKKVFIEYAKHFSGFRFDDQTNMFTGKSKKHYDDAHKLCVAFLEDPLNNIWTWAERNIEIAPKAFDLKDVTKWASNAIKKAQKENVSKGDLLAAMFEGGFELDDLLKVMDKLGYQADVKAE